MIGYGGVRRGCVQTSAGLKHDCTQWGQLVRVRISGLRVGWSVYLSLMASGGLQMWGAGGGDG